MEMTEGDIVRSYVHAESPSKQIGVLADLNACSRKEIKEILKRNGLEVPAGKPGRPKIEKVEVPDEVLDAVKEKLVKIDKEIAEHNEAAAKLGRQRRAIAEWLKKITVKTDETEE